MFSANQIAAAIRESASSGQRRYGCLNFSSLCSLDPSTGASFFLYLMLGNDGVTMKMENPSCKAAFPDAAARPRRRS
jgi:hypothetical protein